MPADDPGFDSPPVPPESPALERLMLLEEGHCLREQALAVCGKVKPVAMASYGATSLTTLLQMVAHGLGVTLIPEMAMSASRRRQRSEDRALCRPDAVAQRSAWPGGATAPRHEECMELARIIRGLKHTLLAAA